MPAKRTSQRANTMLDRLAARSLAPVPELPEAAELPAVEPETPAAKRTRTPRAAAMPAEQPPAARRVKAAAKADEPGAFPNRVTQTLSDVQFDALDELNRKLNRERRAAGHEQVYTVTGLIRAAIDVCMSDPRLQARMVKAAAEPRLSGRGRR
jgi:hypothetical protein